LKRVPLELVIEDDGRLIVVNPEHLMYFEVHEGAHQERDDSRNRAVTKLRHQAPQLAEPRR